MATTHGIHHEREPQGPAVPPDVHLRRRKVMLVLGTLTANVSYTAGLTLPGWVCRENGDAHTAGDPLLVCDVRYRWTYEVYFYCNAVAFLASLAAIALLVFQANQRIAWYAQRVAMTLSLLGLIVSNYIAGSWLTFMSVLLYTALQILAFLFKPLKIELSSVQRTPEKWPKFLRSKKKKNLLKLEQKYHGQQNILSGRGGGDTYKILKRSQMHLLLLGILTAIVTYQAGLNPWGGFWQGKAAATHQRYLGGNSILHHKRKRYLVFFFCNLSAFAMSMATSIIIILGNVFSTRGTKYHSALQAGVTLELLSLIGAYVAGSSRQQLSMSKLLDWDPLYVVIHVVVFLLQVFLVCALWWQALREKIECCIPGWLKKLLGMTIEEHTDDDDDDEEEEEEEDEQEEEEEVAIKERKQEKRRKLLLLLAILAAILAYHGSASPRPDKLGSYWRWRLAFQYCKAAVFMASLSIITMLANRKLPEARGVRWHALRVCVILEVIGLMGAFAAGGYREISTTDVLVLVLAVLLFTAFHLTMFKSGTARGLVQGLGWPQLLIGVDPFAEEDNGSDDELELGIAGGTNEEPLGFEISSPILGGSLTLILAVPVMAILADPMKLLVAIMVASIAVSIWRRSFARLLRALARALQRRCTTATPPTASSSHREQLVSASCQGLCKVIHTLCLGTWMWLLILVISVPSLRPNLKLKFKMSKISGVLGVLVVGAPIMAPATLNTPDTATMDTSTTTTAAANTVTGNPTTAATAASSTSMGRGDEPPLESRLRRNRRPNSRLIGQEWVN